MKKAFIWSIVIIVIGTGIEIIAGIDLDYYIGGLTGLFSYHFILESDAKRKEAK